MPKTRKITTNFSKGELSPRLEGHTDLAPYFEGGSALENVLILRQGGATRRPGFRFVAEVKDSSADTILLPFQASVDAAYILEVGNQYMRVYRNKAQLLSGGVPVEIVTPYLTADLRTIHFTQSADVMYLFNAAYQQQKLSRISDTSWSISAQAPNPPPSFEADTDLAQRMALAANTGTGIVFRVTGSALLAADNGRQLKAGAGLAMITAITNASSGTADILALFDESITAGPNTLTSVGTTVTSTAHGAAAGDFVKLTSGAQSGELREIASIGGPDTFVIDAAFSVDQGAGVTWNLIDGFASGAWKLGLSPQCTLDPNISQPPGAQVTLTAGAAAFRSADVGKYIKIYGGVVKITTVSTSSSIVGTLLSGMGDTTKADPDADPAGAWTLEVASWSNTNGYPRTGEFFQGRLYQASTAQEPTTFWGSASDDYDNYAIGVTAEDAVAYPIASRQVNRIEWIADNQSLFLGTSGTELTAIGSGNANAIIGGNNVPKVDTQSQVGSAPIQSVVTNRQTLFVDRSLRRLMSLGYDIYSDAFLPREITVGAEHITAPAIQLGPVAFQRRIDPRMYFVRTDGTLVSMTFFPEQKVEAFTRLTTDGLIESVAAIPTEGGGPDQIWCVVKRTINGQIKRFIELMEEDHESLSTRPWTSLQTDSAQVYNGAPATVLTGLNHLEGATVDVVADSGYRGTKVVSGGSITLDEAASVVEVGLHYDSTMTTFRPAIPNQVIEGLPRSWDKLWLRLLDTIGGTINREDLQYAASALDTKGMFTGDVVVTGKDWDTDGRVTITQTQPYPMTVLALFGTLSIADHD